MGCFPVGKMVSKALRKCKGRRRHSIGTRMVYSSPPRYSYARSMAKHGTFNVDTPMVITPPEPTQVVPPISRYHPEAAVSPSTQAEMIQPKEQCRVRFAPGSDYPSEPVNATRVRPTQVRFAAEADHHDNFPHPSQKEQARLRSNFEMNAAGPNQNEPATMHTGLDGYRYMTSPLPRWDEGERRREYFGSEYHSYPTPVREGIYRIATDPNRLTTIFSEENPNACSIA